jgi:hypothetical protein
MSRIKAQDCALILIDHQIISMQVIKTQQRFERVFAVSPPKTLNDAFQCGPLS